MGDPQARWMVYFMEKPNLKWMITGGSPISGNPHIASPKLSVQADLDNMIYHVFVNDSIFTDSAGPLCNGCVRLQVR